MSIFPKSSVPVIVNRVSFDNLILQKCHNIVAFLSVLQLSFL